MLMLALVTDGESFVGMPYGKHIHDVSLGLAAVVLVVLTVLSPNPPSSQSFPELSAELVTVQVPVAEGPNTRYGADTVSSSGLRNDDERYPPRRSGGSLGLSSFPTTRDLDCTKEQNVYREAGERW